MLTFDSNQMIDRFQAKVKAYLDNNPTDFFNKKLVLSSDCKQIYIGSEIKHIYVYKYNSIIGYKTSGIKRNKRTNAEFASHIIELYAKTLQNRVKKQSQMSSAEIFTMIYKDKSERLFSTHAYIDWLISHLDDWSDDDVNIAFTYPIYTSKDNADYFLGKLIEKLPNCKKISVAFLNRIVSSLCLYIHAPNQYCVTPQISTLAKQLYNIVNHQHLIDKINNNQNLNYVYLLLLFKASNIRDIKLPIMATLFLNPKNADYYNINYQIENKNTLQTFINALYEYPHRIPYALDIITKHNVVMNFADHQEVLKAEIKTIQTKFNYVERFQEILKILVTLLSKKINKKKQTAEGYDQYKLLKSLKMYSVDTMQIKQQFHDQMTEYLNDHPANYHTKSNDTFTGTLAFSASRQQLYINDFNHRPDFNKVFMKDLSRNKRTNAEFADLILETYAKRLQAKKAEQLNTNAIFADLGGVELYEALFSSKAYIDWIVDNLETWNDTMYISRRLIMPYWSEGDNVDYLVKKLAAKIPSCKQINSDVINQIVKIILVKYANPRRHSTFYPLVTTLSKQLYRIINFPSLKAVTDLRNLDYKNLLCLFKLSKMQNIKLPLVATLSSNLHPNANVVYQVKDLNALKLFVDRICSRKPYLAKRVLTIIAKHKVVFEFDGYREFLNAQIDIIKQDFNYIEQIQQVPEALVALSTL